MECFDGCLEVGDIYLFIYVSLSQGRVEELGKAVTIEMKKELQNAYSKLGYHRLTDAVKNL